MQEPDDPEAGGGFQGAAPTCTSNQDCKDECEKLETKEDVDNKVNCEKVVCLSDGNHLSF